MRDSSSNVRDISKYLVVADYIRREISSGRIGPGGRVPTVVELKERLNASTSVVDRALLLLEAEGLIDRQHGRGVFVTPSARRLKKVIGVLLDKLDTSYSFHYCQPLIQGLREGLESRKFDLLLVHPENLDFATRVDGLIVHGDLFYLGGGVPAVSVVNPSRLRRSVVADDVQGVRLAVEHLLSLGHRKIAYMTWPETDSVSGSRVAAYREALRDAGITPQREWHFEAHFVRKGGGTAADLARLNMMEWFDADWYDGGCTAILGINDGFAAGIIRAAREVGIRTPDDLSVVGFDGIDEGGLKLTTIEVPLAGIGAAAARALLAEIDGQRLDTSRITLPVKLIVGETTAPPRL